MRNQPNHWREPIRHGRIIFWFVVACWVVSILGFLLGFASVAWAGPVEVESASCELLTTGGSGTAFLTPDHTACYVLTCKHATSRKGQTIRCEFWKQNPKYRIVVNGKVISQKPDSDLACIKIPLTEFTAGLPYMMPLADFFPEVGDTIYSYGFPGRGAPGIFAAKVQGYIGTHEIKWDRAPIRGHSGGGIFDENCDVLVGVLTRTQQQLGYGKGESIGSIYDFLGLEIPTRTTFTYDWEGSWNAPLEVDDGSIPAGWLFGRRQRQPMRPRCQNGLLCPKGGGGNPYGETPPGWDGLGGPDPNPFNIPVPEVPEVPQVPEVPEILIPKAPVPVDPVPLGPTLSDFDGLRGQIEALKKALHERDEGRLSADEIAKAVMAKIEIPDCPSEDTIVRAVLAKIEIPDCPSEDAIADKVFEKIKSQFPVEAPSGISHFVLVSSEYAPYWSELSGLLKKARGYYSIEAISPDRNVGPLPALVAYKDHDPVGKVVGVHGVKAALQDIANDAFTF